MSVYFIQNKLTKKIKIGLSKDPYKRMRELQNACGDPLDIILFVNTGGEDKLIEQNLHERFSDSRSIGEWFEPSNEIMSFIEGYRLCLSNKGFNDSNMEFNFNERKSRTVEEPKFAVPIDDYTTKLLSIAANERNMNISDIVYSMLQCAIEVYYKTTNRHSMIKQYQ